MTILLLLLALGAGAPGPASDPAAAEVAPPTPAEEIRYPIGRLPVEELLRHGDHPFVVTDLRYAISDPGRTRHSFAARVRYRDVGYLGAELEGERRGLTLSTHRLALSASSDDGAWQLAADYRASRFVLSAGARRRGPGDHTWVVEPALAFRITPDLEIQGWLVTDTRRPGDRLLTEAGGDLYWQRGSRLAALAEFVRTYELVGVRPDENRRDTGLALAVAQLGALELSVQASLDDVSGRFPRRESELQLGARLPLARRLLFEGASRDRFDLGSGQLFHEHRTSLSWHGRPVTLPRAGLAARREVELARLASRGGEYEINVFDEEGLRAQRQRLALSPRREELRESIEAVYRDQVEERPLPLVGLEWRRRADALSDERAHVGRVFVGIPWPPALPWRARESSVPFLELGYEHEWRTSATSHDSGADSMSFVLSLSREMDIVARWTRASATALDVVRGVPERRRFEVSYVFARDR